MFVYIAYLHSSYLHTASLLCSCPPSQSSSTWLSKPEEMSVAVEAALKAGYRLLDCAHFYGNEVEIGETLQKCFREGVCKREDLFITSKLWLASIAEDEIISRDTSFCNTAAKPKLDSILQYTIYIYISPNVITLYILEWDCSTKIRLPVTNYIGSTP